MSNKLKIMKQDWETKFPDNAFPNDLVLFIETENLWSSYVKGRVLSSQIDNPLLSHSYLNAKAKSNADTMSNIRAMTETAEHFMFIAELRSGVLGIWRCPLRGWLSLWLLDDEGQYVIATGQTLAEAFVNDSLLNHDKVTASKLSNIFQDAGIVIAEKTEDEIFASMDKAKKRSSVSPTAYRHTIYLYLKKSANIGFLSKLKSLFGRR